MPDEIKSIRWLEDLNKSDIGSVGGKNASLGEMMRNLTAEGIRVPPGFATTADAYRAFLRAAALEEIQPAAAAAQLEASRGVLGRRDLAPLLGVAFAVLPDTARNERDRGRVLERRGCQKREREHRLEASIRVRRPSGGRQ